MPVQYATGLIQLGIEAYWIDLFSCKRDRSQVSYLVDKFFRVADGYGLGDKSLAILNKGERFFGISENDLVEIAEAADLIICLAGSSVPRGILSKVKRRLYLDLDPGFTQIWAQQWDMGFDEFNFFLTTGLSVGEPDFPLSLAGVKWIKTRPPIVLDFWPPVIDSTAEKFTTVAQWREEEAWYRGEYYGPKCEEFRKFISLPRLTDQKFELALLIDPSEKDDLSLLTDNGWIIVDPTVCAKDIASFQDYVRCSRAEFSVAKNGYVKSRSGWFSERPAEYLASGKPVLLQDTGFSKFLPTGKGLLSFTTLHEALDGIERINNDYINHCTAARRIAEEYFDSKKVLTQLLKNVGL